MAKKNIISTRYSFQWFGVIGDEYESGVSENTYPTVEKGVNALIKDIQETARTMFEDASSDGTEPIDLDAAGVTLEMRHDTFSSDINLQDCRNWMSWVFLTVATYDDGSIKIKEYNANGKLPEDPIAKKVDDKLSKILDTMISEHLAYDSDSESDDGDDDDDESETESDDENSNNCCVNCGETVEFKEDEISCVCPKCKSKVYKECPFCHSTNISNTDGEYFCENCNYTF